MNDVVVIIVLLWLAAVLIATGWMDCDWQLVSYRYSEWHRTVEYWEFNPYLKVNWWIAWQFSVFRLLIGAGLLGFLSCEIVSRRRV